MSMNSLKDPNMSSPFQELPVELILRILSFLHLHGLIATRSTSRLFHQIIDSSVLLQYIIYMQTYGVEDNPTSTRNVAERLDRLQKHEDAWSNLKIAFTKTIDVQHLTSGIYDLSAGIYVLGEGSRYWRRYTTAIHWLQLPSSPQEEPQWNIIDVGARIIDIGLAVREHDLIAVVTSTTRSIDPSTAVTEVVFLQLSTGTPHPLAKTPKLFVNTTTTETQKPSISIEIVGRFMALITSCPNGNDSTDRFYFFDWMDGTLILDRESTEGMYTGIIFLSPDVLLLPNIYEESLDIWRIPNTNMTHPSRLNFPTLRLRLPTLNTGKCIRNISCRSEPNPTASPPKNLALPFYNSPADAVAIFSLSILTLDPVVMSSASFVVHRSALLKLANSPPSLTTPTTLTTPTSITPRDIPTTPYESWGPRITRWFGGDQVPMPQWITASDGQRFVYMRDADEDVPVQRPSAFVVCDFNPYSVSRFWLRSHSPPHLDTDSYSLPGSFPEESNDARHAHLDLENANARRILITGESELEDGDFEEPVHSELPYVMCTTERRDYRYDGVLMEEERLVGITSDLSGHISSFDVMYLG